MNEKNGLNTNLRSNPEIKKYFENGYKVTEMFFPSTNTYMITKEKGDNVFYYHRSPTICTQGVYNRAEFNKQMEQLNKQFSEWDSQLEQQLNNLDATLQSTASHSNTTKQKNHHSGSCLGCFVWTILILCIICVILYCMGIIGSNVFHFLTDFFQKIF